MNIKEYIASGILEQYLLGALSAPEEKEVETMMAKHPEVRQEIFLLSDTLEKVALQSAIKPPHALKDSILKEIDPTHIDEKQTKEQRDPDKPKLALPSLIASLLALLVLAFICYNCFKSKETLTQQIEFLTQEIDTLNAAKLDLTARLDQATQNLNIVTGSQYKQVLMQGLPISPQSFAQVFWNESTNDVYLSPSGLPAPASGKQYQLWAIVDGTPLSMGVFDLLAEGTALIKMNSVANAATFAITLEDQGGVESPTLEAMYVAGNVSS